MSVVSWLEDKLHPIFDAMTAEEKALVTFFTPLFNQILAQAKILGKQDVQAGLKVIFDAAASAASTAANAPFGMSKVQAAESAFASTVVSEGKTAVNNAEAATIKAAVAILQTAPQTLGIAATDQAVS